MAGFDISEFKSIVSKNGLLKNNLYLVSFQGSPFPNKLMFYTSTFSVPGIDMDSISVARHGYGPIEKIAFRPMFAPLSMSFMVEASEQNVIAAVLKSMSSSVAFMNYKSLNATSGQSLYGGVKDNVYPYELAYKKDYEFNLSVFIYNETQDTILTYTFNQCYCTHIGGLELGWNNNDNLLRVDITFQFTDYSIEATTSTSDNTDGSVGQIQQTLGLGSLSQTSSAIMNPFSINGLINNFNSASLSL